MPTFALTYPPHPAVRSVPSPFLTPVVAALLCIGGCMSGAAGGDAAKHAYPADSAARKTLFEHYIDTGNAFYAEKAGYSSFQKSLRYFDSAQALANYTGDTPMLADAVFARGRVYDAWNKEPQKTIEYFSEAAALLKTIPGEYTDYLYVRQLVAHAYEKARDTAGAAGVLRGMYAELIKTPQAARDTLSFLSEGALIATEVGAYTLADSILHHLTRRAVIANDSETYNYLDHYYLTQARVDAYWRRPAHLPYLDSLASVYHRADNLMDRAFYADRLAALYAATGDTARAYHYLTTFERLRDSIEASGDVAGMQQALVQSEVAAERSRTHYEDRLRGARSLALWGLSALLAIITVMTVYLYRRNQQYRAQSQSLGLANTALDEKVAQVELLNKEIQHRVKNNLHMVYSLLHMQERKTENEETVAQLQAARLRVESIAALHNQLLSGNGNVNFGAYMRGLISSVVSCLSDDKKVVTHLSTETIVIPPNSYLALSLVLNEWVTNSIKYATPRDGMIEITVDIRNKDKEVCIDYRDNGAADSKKPAQPGLGTQIIQLLTKQMTAKLTTLPGQPYHYRLCIPHGA